MGARLKEQTSDVGRETGGIELTNKIHSENA
jgi:hypothetical protein